MEGNNSGVFNNENTCSLCSLWFSGYCAKHHQATFAHGHCDNFKISKMKQKGDRNNGKA